MGKKEQAPALAIFVQGFRIEFLKDQLNKCETVCAAPARIFIWETLQQREKRNRRGRGSEGGKLQREKRGGREREGGRPVQCTNPHNPKAVLRNLRGSGANETLH